MSSPDSTPLADARTLQRPAGQHLSQFDPQQPTRHDCTRRAAGFLRSFALDEIIPGAEIKMRFHIQTSTGKTIQHRFRLRHRTDKRPVFDLLFRMLE